VMVLLESAAWCGTRDGIQNVLGMKHETSIARIFYRLYIHKFYALFIVSSRLAA
jgi:hypothetical protein